MQKDEMEKVYQEYAQSVYGFLLLRTHDSQLAEELTQETFYQALRSVEKFDGSCKVSTWLCAIAKNVLLKYWQKNKVPVVALDDEQIILAEDASVEEIFLAEENKVELMAKIHQLPQEMKEVIYLRLAADLSFKQIGEIMNKTEIWARVTFYRGKEKLLKEEK